MKSILTILSVLLVTVSLGMAQKPKNMGRSRSRATDKSASLEKQFKELRAEIVRLRSALEKNHKAMSSVRRGGMGMGMANMKKGMAMGKKMSEAGQEKMKSGMQMGKKGMAMGMKMSAAERKKMSTMKMGGMKMGKKMSSMGKMGMRMMGRSPRQDKMPSISSLPGFPGISHLYHIGATGFYLDHADHLKLTKQQLAKLGSLQEKSALEQATMTRQEEQVEQEIWVLTSKGAPDTAALKSKLNRVAALGVKRRMMFIRAVGSAAKILTDKQRNLLKGQTKTASATPDSRPATKGLN